MAHATINCHPLVNTMTTSIAREGLVRFLEATGHPPRIAALGEEDGLANRIANPPADPI
jgi:Ala-tRNA(Pro) deacylase